MKDSSLSANSWHVNMESLESKLDRLLPGQRKEVEEFVDFLLYRSGNVSEPPPTPVLPDLQRVAPPPFPSAEPVHAQENPLGKVDDTNLGDNSSSPVKNEEQVKQIREIIVGNEQVSGDYMDYGQFEQKSSPAITAVKNVKEKLQKREEQEKPRVSLDWID
jgi:hypothetical protein